jgi:IclR family transcriptional regulator, acetate operon repressor
LRNVADPPGDIVRGVEKRSVVDGAFRVLRALPDAGTEHQISRLSALTKLPRPTVYRLLDQLAEAGAVEAVNGRWVLSTGLVQLAHRAEPFAGLREPASRVLQSLREQIAATVSLVVPSGGGFVVLESVLGGDALPDARPGATMPAFTAAGVLLGDGTRTGVFVDHRSFVAGMTCYAAPVSLPGGAVAALQVSSRALSAEQYAGAAHHAAVALSRQVRAA